MAKKSSKENPWTPQPRKKRKKKANPMDILAELI